MASSSSSSSPTVPASRTIPAPRTRDLRDAPSLGWGIMGAGSIAERFVESLHRHTGQRVVAVSSRTAAQSADFAGRHGVASGYASNEALVADAGVDIVYVSAPNSRHYDCTMLALRAGKHVLVEKAFAADAEQARAMVEEAESRGLFLMEAMWPRFLPFMDSVRQLLETGAIGEPLSLTADLGDYDEFDSDGRMYSPALGGGITLDRGIYLASLSSFLIGATKSVAVVGLQAPTGVDAHLAMTLGNGRGAHSQLLATMYAKTPSNAYFSGTLGSITFAAPWYLSPKVTLLDSAGTVLDTLDSPLDNDVDALCYEAVEAARMIAAGHTSSPLMPARESLAISETLDTILRTAHAQWDAA